MRLYIAGPMTYIPQYNFPAFDLMAGLVRGMGHEVVSPAELDDPKDRALALASPDGAPQTGDHFGKTWGDFLARDVKLLADDGIEGIVVLPGWETSRGARLETFVAHALCGMPIFHMTLHAGLVSVSELVLFRAWTGDPTLRIRQEVYA